MKKTASTSKLSCSTRQSPQTKKERSSKTSSQIKRCRSEGDLGSVKKFLIQNTCGSGKEKVLKRRLDYETVDRLSVPEVYIIDDEDSDTKPKVAKDVNPKAEELEKFLDDKDRDISDMLADALGSDSDIDRTDSEEENLGDANGKMKHDDDVKEEEFSNGDVKVILTPAEDEDSCGSVDFMQHLLDSEDESSCQFGRNSVKDDKQCSANLSKTPLLSPAGKNLKASQRGVMGRKGSTGKKGGRETTLHSQKEVIDKSQLLSSELKSLNQCGETEVMLISTSDKSDQKPVAHSPSPKAPTAASKQSSLLSFFQAKGGLRHVKKDTSVNKNAALKPELAEKQPASKPASRAKLEANDNSKSKPVTRPNSVASKSGFDSDQSNSSTGVERKKPTRNCPFYKKIPGN